jgi:hypothetical protein
MITDTLERAKNEHSMMNGAILQSCTLKERNDTKTIVKPTR